MPVPAPPLPLSRPPSAAAPRCPQPWAAAVDMRATPHSPRVRRSPARRGVRAWRGRARVRAPSAKTVPSASAGQREHQVGDGLRLRQERVVPGDDERATVPARRAAVARAKARENAAVGPWPAPAATSAVVYPCASCHAGRSSSSRRRSTAGVSPMAAARSRSRSPHEKCAWPARTSRPPRLIGVLTSLAERSAATGHGPRPLIARGRAPQGEPGTATFMRAGAAGYRCLAGDPFRSRRPGSSRPSRTPQWSACRCPLIDEGGGHVNVRGR